ncbi:PadR family transcriptional regulator [Lysinibacillus telephonicus]|uniref:PadR family transcriptional regulator n=1 Tax=Lysinibacillus telephonicus TaxID=1714840 RepID=UPI003B9EC2D7
MDERLKGLKKAMNNHTFRQVKFTDAHRQKINEQIEQLEDQDVTKFILSLLTQERTGSELTQLLHVRGIKTIINNEGIVYTILHAQEQQGIIESYWTEDDEKYYKLTNKGMKILQKKKVQKSSRDISLKQLFNEVTLNEH